jgi:hypothetical protein
LGLVAFASIQLSISPSQPFTLDIITANMKASLLCSATLFSLATFAFPTNLLKGDISEDTLAEITSLAAKISRDLETRGRAGNVKRGFNAEAQRISTTGKNAYVRGIIKMQDAVCRVANDFSFRLRQAQMTSVGLVPV